MGETIGFIGLGRMGARMCARLLDAGYALAVNDVNEAVATPLVTRGARWAATPRAVADGAGRGLVSLPSPAIVREVALAAGAGNRITTFVDLSTTGPRVASEIAAALHAKGI